MATRRRIAVVLDRFSGSFAAEFTQFTEAIVRTFENDNDVVRLCSPGSNHSTTPASRTRRVKGRQLGKALSEFDPNLVVYFPSPRGICSICAHGYRLRRSTRHARHVVVNLSPLQSERCFKPLLRFFCPGQILVSSYRSLLLLSRFSLKGGVLPVGVDQRLFRKVGIGEKAELRKRFGIDQKAFVFLLADPVRDLDDLQPVSPLRDVAGSVIAARIGPDANARIHSSLRGVRIMPFEQSLPDLYGLSDCVVFYKTAQKERLEIPMSVIEALSCGVPVLAKPFGGLRDFLSAGDDVCYWSSRGELVRAAQRLRAISPVRVRSMKQFAWERVAARVTENTAM